MREYIVDLECEILEECVPVTVGVGAEIDDDAEESADIMEIDEETFDEEDAIDDYSEDEYDDEY